MFINRITCNFCVLIFEWSPFVIFLVQECVDWCLKSAENVHNHKGGLLNPTVCLMSDLKIFLETHLPEDAHVTASGRVFISVTENSSKKNMIISEYDTKEDLIEV